MSIAQENRKHYAYLDFLRILAAFLVIVNHTNSYVFKAMSPENTTWWLSILWYYASKIAVPLFVMISGACLLGKQDTYRKAFGRFLRVLIVLLLFSYAYYLVNLWETYWTWRKALDFPAFFAVVWRAGIADSFWYLYLYLGLMVMLPFLQRLAGALQKRDVLIFIGLSLLFFAVWPLAAHYAPALALPKYFDAPLFGVFIGLFFAGYYLHAYAEKDRVLLCTILIIVTLAAAVWLTQIEYGRVVEGEKYWFMDERTAPSILTVLGAFAVFALVKHGFTSREPLAPKAAKRWTALGGCAFGVYLVQEMLIVETRRRVFATLTGVMNPLLAALLWEAGVFTVALAIAWLMKRVPLLKKLI